MKILHVVTLVTPDGAFGGPVRVAANHVRELLRLGHDARLVAAHSGFPTVPTEVDGVPANLFSAHRVAPLGFSGLLSPSLLVWLWRELPSCDYVHVHLARDLITLPAARLVAARRVPMVAQPHGMIGPSSRRLAHLLDLLATGQTLRSAVAVCHLTERERCDLTKVGGPDLRLAPLGNGTEVVDVPPLPEQVNVLFLARLHERKRPLAFVEMAGRLLDEGLDATFSIVGPDEGQLPAVLQAIEISGHSESIVYEGPLAPNFTNARIARASLVVLPSVHEPFPMSILEAMALGRPVVVTDTCGIAGIVSRTGAGKVTTSDVKALTTAVAGLLAGGPNDLERISLLAKRAADTHFSAEMAARMALDLAMGVGRSPKQPDRVS